MKNKALMMWAVLAFVSMMPVTRAAADPPETRIDVLEAIDGECRSRWVLEPGETRMVYCDLQLLSKRPVSPPSNLRAHA